MLNIFLVFNTVPYMYIIIDSFVIDWCSRGKTIFIRSTFLALWILSAVWFFSTFSFMWWVNLTEIELLFVDVYSLLVMPGVTLFLYRPVGRRAYQESLKLDEKERLLEERSYQENLKLKEKERLLEERAYQEKQKIREQILKK